MTINTLKTLDDHVPLQFAADGDTFKLQAGSEASWLSGETFGHKELRSRIEPWLTSLFQSEHLSLLAGSGLRPHGRALGGLENDCRRLAADQCIG